MQNIDRSGSRAPLGLARGVVILFAICGVAPAAAQDVPATADSVYTTGRPSADGIGKFYFGREISRIMGHQGVNWLERDEREGEERPDLVVDAMDLAPDAVVADIGAGSGYFTSRLADRVPAGRVFLVEYRGEDPDVPIKPLHKMTTAQAILEMGAVGLQWVVTRDFLPSQHFMVFAKPDPGAGD